MKLKDNLVSYWPLNGDLKDKVKVGNDGKAIGTGAVTNIDYQNGKYGKAAYLDGTNAIQISGNIKQNFSISIWCTIWEVADLAKQHIAVLTLHSGGSGTAEDGPTWHSPKLPIQCLVAKGQINGWGIMVDGETKKTMRFSTNGAFYLASLDYKPPFTGDELDSIPGKDHVLTGSDTFDTWYHIVGVVDSKTGFSTLYVNGVGEPFKGDIVSNLENAKENEIMMIGDNPFDGLNKKTTLVFSLTDLLCYGKSYF